MGYSWGFNVLSDDNQLVFIEIVIDIAYYRGHSMPLNLDNDMSYQHIKIQVTDIAFYKKIVYGLQLCNGFCRHFHGIAGLMSVTFLLNANGGFISDENDVDHL